MDFRPPPRGYYADYTPQRHRPPAPAAAPPKPPEPAARNEPKAQEETAHKKVKHHTSRRLGWKKPLIALIIIGVVAWLAYGYITTKNQLTSLKGSGATAAQTPTQQLINKISQLVALPPGENPTIATVNDASKLKSQQFFANAKDGDKLLIYSKSGMAVLYRPSTNRVIEYSKVNLSAATPS
jgi:hypothetical protein